MRSMEHTPGKLGTFRKVKCPDWVCGALGAAGCDRSSLLHAVGFVLCVSFVWHSSTGFNQQVNNCDADVCEGFRARCVMENALLLRHL